MIADCMISRFYSDADSRLLAQVSTNIEMHWMLVSTRQSLVLIMLHVYHNT